MTGGWAAGLLANQSCSIFELHTPHRVYTLEDPTGKLARRWAKWISAVTLQMYAGRWLGLRRTAVGRMPSSLRELASTYLRTPGALAAWLHRVTAGWQL